MRISVKLRQYFACFERAWLCRMDRNRALFLAAIFFVWKRAWPALLTIIVAVPGGMLLNELLKLAVHRHGPFLDGWFVDWSGYTFASGHTIGATLLYGQLLLFLLPLMKSKRWQRLSILSAGDAGDAGWIQSHCSWRALSQRRHRSDISRCSLADDLHALVKADAT